MNVILSVMLNPVPLPLIRIVAPLLLICIALAAVAAVVAVCIIRFVKRKK